MILHYILYALSFIGLLYLFNNLNLTKTYLIHWLKHKKWPLSQEEQKMVFLQNHISNQQLKIKSLESQVEKMTLSLLKHIT